MFDFFKRKKNENEENLEKDLKKNDEEVKIKIKKIQNLKKTKRTIL